MAGKKRRFLQDYQYREGINGTREVIYTGKYYQLVIKDRRIRYALFALPFILLSVILASGLDSSGASHNPFITLPVIVSVLPSAFIVIGCFPAATGGGRTYKEREKYRSCERVSVSFTAVVILYGFSAIAGIVYQTGKFKIDGNFDLQAVVQLALAALGCTAVFFCRKAYKKTVLFNPVD